MLQSGEIQVGDKAYNVNTDTNEWKAADGEVISGDEMLDLMQQEAGGYDLKQDIYFRKFKGTSDWEQAEPENKEKKQVEKPGFGVRGLPIGSIFK
jgi:hypothetical protein